MRFSRAFRYAAFSSSARVLSTNATASSSLLPKLALVGAGLSLGALTMANFSDAASIPRHGVPGTPNERTFIAIKPDGVQRHLVAEVIRRFEAKGYKLVGLKLVQPTEKFAAQHYADLSKKPFFPALIKYFSSGPVVAMVWEGTEAIKNGRKIVGATNPADAEMGSIRGDFCVAIGRNVIHGSDGPDGARDEINLWFNDAEICSWQAADYAWVYEK